MRASLGADPGGPAPLFLAKSVLFFYIVHNVRKNIFEIEFGFYSGRNPRSFWKCGRCMRVCVNRNRGHYCFFCSAKAQFWMISEAFWSQKYMPDCRKSHLIFQNFLGEAPQTSRRRSHLRRSVRGFVPLPGPPFPKFLDPPLIILVYQSWDII